MHHLFGVVVAGVAMERISMKDCQELYMDREVEELDMIRWVVLEQLEL